MVADKLRRLGRIYALQATRKHEEGQSGVCLVLVRYRIDTTQEGGATVSAQPAPLIVLTCAG